MNSKILILDDDISVLNSFQLYLQESGHTLVLCQSAEEAISKFKQEPQNYICAFIDFQLKNEFGEQESIGHEVAKDLHEIDPSLYAVMMSGDNSKEALQSWLSVGIDKFIYKPLSSDQISSFVQYAKELHTERNPYHSQSIVNDHGLVGISQNIKSVSKLTKKFAPYDETVLIMGETGTGKELIAKALHEQSKRVNKPFIAINCAAISGNLFESELFGHVKGAFTGADSNKLGKFREAHGGTIFLDEIHHLTLNQQAKILRVIQEKAVVPVGDKIEYKVDFRLICASKPRLRELSLKNEFLIDLFFRISSLNIEVEPLRKRHDDIDVLVRYFQKLIEKKDGSYKRIAPSAMKLLQEYSWPGNVRELKKVITELYLTIDRSTIKPVDLPSYIKKNHSSVIVEDGMTMIDLDEKQREQKRLLINNVMPKVSNNKTKAAELLSMKRSTFIWHLHDLGLFERYDTKKNKKKPDLTMV